MKLSFGGGAAPQPLKQPKTAQFPELKSAEVAALYRTARSGGDYFDFIAVGHKLLFILMDIAGKREKALSVAAAVQDKLHVRAPQLLEYGEDARAVTTLALELNKLVIEAAGGVCCAPALIGCYDDQISTVSYINAGHMPGLLRDHDGIIDLPSNGLPFGLFSHSTHDAQFCALTPGAALLLASKGLVEARSYGSSRNEFGMGRLRERLRESKADRAISLCRDVLDSVEQFQSEAITATAKIAAAVPGLRPPEPNDATTVAIVRNLNESS
jgi:serine phosphatase RsbU (regulator of sigma subunit)